MVSFVVRSKYLCYLLIVSMLMPSVAPSSVRSVENVKVLNVRFEIVGTKIVVRYDLEGEANKDYTVKIILRREHNQSFLHIPKSVAGEIGEGRFAGQNRQVTWDVLKEFPQGLEGDDYYFVIEVEIVSSGISPLWYIGGGVGIVGGVVGYLLSKGGSEAVTPTSDVFPKPIGRPTGN
jgi:hypothetical protein